MPRIDPSQLSGVAESLNLFRPSGLHDQERVDLSDSGLFLAVDGLRPQEIDDAIRMRRRRNGGFIKQVAVADASQIPMDSEWLAEAVERKKSDYRRHQGKGNMFPDFLLRQLELSTHPKRRALVIETTYDRDMQLTGEPNVFPAFINVRALRLAQFVSYLRQHGGIHDPIVQFDELFRRSRNDLKYGLPKAFDGNVANDKYSSRVVQDCMILANLAFTSYCRQRDAPILRRKFPSVRSLWGVPAPGHRPLHILPQERAGDEVFYAQSTSPLRHAAPLINHQLHSAWRAGMDSEELFERAQRFLQQLTENDAIPEVADPDGPNTSPAVSDMERPTGGAQVTT